MIILRSWGFFNHWADKSNIYLLLEAAHWCLLTLHINNSLTESITDPKTSGETRVNKWQRLHWVVKTYLIMYNNVNTLVLKCCLAWLLVFGLLDESSTSLVCVMTDWNTAKHDVWLIVQTLAAAFCSFAIPLMKSREVIVAVAQLVGPEPKGHWFGCTLKCPSASHSLWITTLFHDLCS